MTIKFAAIAGGLALVLALPFAVAASQPATPQQLDARSAAAFRALIVDPRAAGPLSLILPTGFATFDVDADPFAGR